MRNKGISILVTVLFILSSALTVFAHGGRTDSSGGHKDNKNASGLGSYHYHCGGNPAHLHNSGVCPYSKSAPTPTPRPTATPTPKPTATPAPKPTATPAESAQQTSLIKNNDEKIIVHYIDVGQGDSILIVFPNDETMLIDAGGGNGNKVVNYIKEQSIEKIDYLIITHPHEDHIGGLPNVIRSFDIGKIYMPRATHTTKAYENLLLAIEAKNMQINTAKAGIEFIINNDVTVAFIAPNSETYSNLNDYSIVLHLEYYETSFLFTSDAESTSLNEIQSIWNDYNADVLKVGHHGSNTSNSQKFLEAVNPIYAIIMCGKDNGYGHPTKETLDRLTALKTIIYRTDLNGTIKLISDGKNITVEAEKQVIVWR